MKRFTLKPYLIVLNLFLFSFLFGQTPEKMTYQAVVRNSSNGLVSNHAVGTQISILQGSTAGTAVYVETHTTTTNANGLMTLEIGNGTVIFGSLTSVNWANGPYFLKTETDPSGGNNYTISGVSQLLSVPFALHAKTAETLSNGITETDPLFTASPSFGISGTNITNWNNAFGWGNHALAGYLTSFLELDPKIGTNTAGFSPKWDGTTLVTGAVFQNDIGNIGIGTINPLSKLSVDGDANITTSLSTPIIQPLVGEGTTLTLLTNNATNASGGITIKTGNTTTNLTPNSTGSINIQTGNTYTNGAVTGSITLSAGKELWTGLSNGASLVLGGYPGVNQGGSAILSGGNSWSDSGSVSLQGGNAGAGSGGNVYIKGGNGGASVGGAGHVFLSSGNDSSAGPGSLFFRINNLDAMHINALSNVGIGTVNPEQKLDVQGYINAASGLCIGGNCKSSWLSISPWINNGNDFYYNAGKIGIGTSTPTTPLDVNGIITALDGNSTYWNTAYSWGNHATAGYLISFTETDPLWSASPSFGITNTNIANWNTAYGWGNHATAGYLTSVDGSETKVTAGTNVTITGSGTTASPYVVNATGTTTLTIGQSYQGGIIFWLDASGQHGLIAATTDQSTGIQWYNGSYTTTNAVRDGIDAGLYNTERIIANQGVGSYAAQLCANYQGGGYGDWYLPSKYELNLLYLQKTAVGGFASAYYWSSTEDGNLGAWVQYFSHGGQGGNNKASPVYVRAIRAF